MKWLFFFLLLLLMIPIASAEIPPIPINLVTTKGQDYTNHTWVSGTDNIQVNLGASDFIGSSSDLLANYTSFDTSKNAQGISGNITHLKLNASQAGSLRLITFVDNGTHFVYKNISGAYSFSSGLSTINVDFFVNTSEILALYTTSGKVRHRTKSSRTQYYKLGIINESLDYANWTTSSDKERMYEAWGDSTITDGFNISINGGWYNGTSSFYNHTNLNRGDWSNITIQAYNSSGNMNISNGSLSANTQLYNTTSIVTDIGDLLSVSGLTDGTNQNRAYTTTFKNLNISTNNYHDINISIALNETTTVTPFSVMVETGTTIDYKNITGKKYVYYITGASPTQWYWVNISGAYAKFSDGDFIVRVGVQNGTSVFFMGNDISGDNGILRENWYYDGSTWSNKTSTWTYYIRLNASEGNTDAPIDLSYSKIRPTNITLNWTQSLNSTFVNYSIYRSTDATINIFDTLVFVQTDKTNVSYTDMGLSENTQYYYAILEYGSSISMWSNTLNVSTYTPNVNYVLSMGDSITKVPSSYVPGEEYPVKINYSLNNYGDIWTVTSKGVGSERADTGRGRFIDEVQTYRPSIVTIMYGINDLGSGTSVNRAFQDISDDIIWMANESKIRGITPHILLTIPSTTNYNNVKILDTYLLADAASYNISTVDTYDAIDTTINDGIRDSYNASNFITDGVHPNTTGQTLLASKIFNQIYNIGNENSSYLDRVNTTYFYNRSFIGNGTGHWLNYTIISFLNKGFFASPVLNSTNPNATIYYNYPNINITLGFVALNNNNTYSISIPFVTNLTVVPSSDYINTSVSVWNTTGNYRKVWNESSTNTSVTTQHTIGDFPPNKQISIYVDGNLNGTYQSNSTGYITYTYSGGYSEHEFDLSLNPSVSESIQYDTLVNTCDSLSSTYMTTNIIFSLILMIAGIFLIIQQLKSDNVNIIIIISGIGTSITGFSLLIFGNYIINLFMYVVNCQ